MPLYLSEIAPVNVRGSLNIMFQLSITIGILVAELINLGARPEMETLHALPRPPPHASCGDVRLSARIFIAALHACM